MKNPTDLVNYLRDHKAEVLSGIICATAATIVLQQNIIHVQRDMIMGQTGYSPYPYTH